MRRLRGGPGSGSRLDRIPKYTQCSCLTRAPPRPPVPALSLDTPGITNGDKPLSVPRSNGPARQGSRPRAEREIVRHKRQEIHPIIPSAGNQSLGRCGLRDGAAVVSVLVCLRNPHEVAADPPGLFLHRDPREKNRCTIERSCLSAWADHHRWIACAERSCPRK